jgi:hypothetical protein
MSFLRRLITQPARWFAFSWAPALMALAWGCDLSAPADPKPDLNPSLAEIDASWEPSPTRPGHEGFSDGGVLDEDDAAQSSSGGSSGKLADGGGEPKLAQGDFLITEVMFDPSAGEPVAEWIEVHNGGTTARTLTGLTIVDGANRTHVIGAGVTVPAGAYAVLARNKAGAAAAKVPALAIVYEYGSGLADSSGVLLANGSTGSVSLRDGATVVAQADYGGWFTEAQGSSLQLRTLTQAASVLSASWCLAQSPWATGSDKGTPGRANDCP